MNKITHIAALVAILSSPIYSHESKYAKPLKLDTLVALNNLEPYDEVVKQTQIPQNTQGVRLDKDTTNDYVVIIPINVNTVERNFFPSFHVYSYTSESRLDRKYRKHPIATVFPTSNQGTVQYNIASFAPNFSPQIIVPAEDMQITVQAIPMIQSNGLADIIVVAGYIPIKDIRQAAPASYLWFENQNGQLTPNPNKALFK